MEPINIPNYMNINFFCNRLGVGLCDYEITNKKPNYIDSMCSTLTEMLDKFLNWTVEPKYSPIVNKILNSENEHAFFKGCLGEDYKQKAKNISQKVEKIKNSDKIIKPVKESIDYVVDFLIEMSNKSVVAYSTSI